MTNPLHKKIILWALVLVLGPSCDFTPPLYRKIIEAQDLIMAQKYMQAKKKYEQILKGGVPPKVKIKILQQLGDISVTYLGQHREGIKYYRKILAFSDDPYWVVLVEKKVGKIAFEFLKDYTESAASYDRLSRFLPRLSDFEFFQFRLSMSFYHKRQYAKSAKMFKAMAGNPSHKYFLPSMFQMGLIYFYQQDWKRAVSVWAQYIELEKKEEMVTQAKYLMANAYETAEQLDEAYQIYYSLLDSYPNTQVIKDRLEAIYKRKIDRKR